jgi:hypothetical protein
MALRMALGVLALAVCTGVAQAQPKSTPLLRFVAYDQSKVDRDKDRCENRTDFPGPTEIQDCLDRAMETEIKAASKSQANPQFRAFAPELYEPLLSKITGGEDALAEQVVVTGVLTELAGLRAQILNGQNPPLTLGKLAFSRGGTFSWLSDRKMAAELQKRWAMIKAGDCAAYPVPNCDQRLEQALQQKISEALSEVQPQVDDEAAAKAEEARQKKSK